jgi:dTDP-glucose pyrophosphorylase
MTPTLLVLAAGVGSRFGAPKQLEPVGPRGATLVEYSIFDARRSGFGKVVLVVRREMQQRFASLLARRFDPRQVTLVAQDADAALGQRARRAGRTKPWGTAHAVLVSAGAIDTPFLVINADDFYGRASYETTSAWLRGGETSVNETTYALVSFPLAATLSASGGVNRGVCELTPDGWLRTVREVVGIEREGEGGRYLDDRSRVHHLPGPAPVSMNMWAFTPRIFPELADQFRVFMEAIDRHPDGELLLPTAVNTLIAAGRARVRVLPGGHSWCGMTYREDADRVRTMIAELTARGEYRGF